MMIQIGIAVKKLESDHPNRTKGHVATLNKISDNGTAEKLLSTAARLFYANGVRAVGIDWIVAESGVAKTSLYRHFRTKDDLIVAFLRDEDRAFWEKWDEVVAAQANDASAELRGLLKWIGEKISVEGFRGCPQINVAAEFADLSHPARELARAHKVEMLSRLRRIVRRLGVSRPEDRAMQLALLIDGAFTSDGRLANLNSVRILQGAAEALLR